MQDIALLKALERIADALEEANALAQRQYERDQVRPTFTKGVRGD